jgi:hypothetical protein
MLDFSMMDPWRRQLVHNRDANVWQRSAPRDPVIARGPFDCDAGCVFNLSSAPVIVGDEVWLYYTGLTTTHGGTTPPKRGSIALAKWRLDGFELSAPTTTESPKILSSERYRNFCRSSRGELIRIKAMESDKSRHRNGGPTWAHLSP